MSKVNVIIPTHNCARYLPSAIDSVLRQTHQDFDIIVVDDGSTDETIRIINEYCKKNPGKINYYYQDNEGPSKARNTGIKKSKGDYVIFLDADDELMPVAIEKCLKALIKSNSDWCITDILRIENGNKEILNSNVSDGDLIIKILKQDFIRRAPFFKKRVLIDLNFYDESLLIREDWDLNIRLLSERKKFIYINEPLYIYKIRQKSLTKDTNIWPVSFTLKLLQKHHKKLADEGNKEVAEIYSANMWDLGRRYLYELKDIEKAIYCIKESLKYDFSLKRFTHPIYFNFKRLCKI